MDSETLPYIATAAAVGATALYLISSQVKGKVRTTWTPSTPDELSAYASGTRHWNVDPDGEVPPKIAKSGIASTPGRCVHEVFQEAVKNHGGRVALRWESAPGEWKTWTWQQYYDSCCLAARGFMHLGLQPFESVNIIGFNSPEWFFANNGAILAGGKAAGIYTTNGPEACQYITEHSAARVVVVEDEKQLKKFEEVWDRLPNLKAVIVYRPSGPVDKSTKHGQILSWESFMKLADKTPEDALQARMRAQRPGMCCLLIYTSGTTGPPKAVMISHDNICFTAITLLERLGSNYGTDPSNPERGVSYLPLSHIAAQMCDIWAPIYVAGTCASWGEVYFARPDALRGTLVNTLKAARPTMFFGVPRVWEKMMEGMKESGKNNSGMKKKLVGWARGVGGAYQANRQTGGSGVVPIGFAVANKIVFSKVRAALGLDACKIQFTGAAPMAREVFEFFNALNLPIYELYGMSECTGPQTVTHDGGYLVGSTGQSLKGTEIKIDHVPSRDKPGEGEICYRGRHIMMGYMKQPEKTRETIDPEGFLHSGDVGRVDENGFLFITGRIKELIITAGGENIAPVPIENAIKQFCPGLSNVMMVGDKRKFNVCLVTLKTKPDAQGMPSDNELFAEATTVSSAKTVAEAREDKTWLDYIHGGISQYNEKIAVSNAAKIQKFAILPHDFSIAYELTPTLKLKREATAAKYAEVIEKLYSV